MPGPVDHAPNIDRGTLVQPLHVSLREAGNSHDEFQLFIKALRSLTLDPTQLVYRGVSQSRLPIVLQYGTDLPRYRTTFAHNWLGFDTLSMLGECTALEYAFLHPDPMVLAYHSKFMKPEGDPIEGEHLHDDTRVYEFLTDPHEALAAILLLED